MAISHSSTLSTARQESHDRQFRYFVMPSHVCDLVSKKTITAGDAYLLGTIDSFCREPQGCFASNDYLATVCGMKPRWVQTQIAKLIGMGLLVREGGENGERRYLRTTWAHPVILSDPMQDHASPHAGPCMHIIKNRKNNNTASPVVGGFLGKASKETPAQQLAKRIRHLAVEVYKIREPWSQAKWANDLRPLIRKHTEAEVDRVLTALEASPKAFKVHSASGFVKWFDTIRSRLDGPKAKQAPAAPELSEAHREIVGEVIEGLSHLRWPKGSEDLLPSAVARSLAAYLPVFRTLRRLEKEERAKNKFGGFVLYLMMDLCQNPIPFLIRWFTQTHKQVKDWHDWSGDLNQFVFRRDHKRFLAEGRDIASKYGRGNYWQKVQEAINE